MDGHVDPLRDVEVISLELMLADLAAVERRLERAGKDKSGAGEDERLVLLKALAALNSGVSLRLLGLDAKEKLLLKPLMLLSLKQVPPVCHSSTVCTDLSVCVCVCRSPGRSVARSLGRSLAGNLRAERV